jgi:hypothetical protein
MSIASEITRLQGVKADILTAIADKGVDVPAGSALADCPTLIASITGGGGGGGDLHEGYTRYYIIRNRVDITSSNVSYCIPVNINVVNKENYLFGADFINKLLQHNMNYAAPIFKTNLTTNTKLEIDDTNFSYSNGDVSTSTNNNLNLEKISLGVKGNRLYNLDTELSFPGNVNYVEQSGSNILLLGGKYNRITPAGTSELLRFFIKNGDDYIINCLPCKRNSDGYIGVFDLISQSFFAAADQSVYELI